MEPPAAPAALAAAAAAAPDGGGDSIRLLLACVADGRACTTASVVRPVGAVAAAAAAAAAMAAMSWVTCLDMVLIFVVLLPPLPLPFELLAVEPPMDVFERRSVPG